MSELITCTCGETYYTYDDGEVWKGWEEWLQCLICNLPYKDLLQKKVDAMRKIMDGKPSPECSLSPLRRSLSSFDSPRVF